MRAFAVVALLATNAHAIVGGTPSAEPAVVALVRGDELVCSGAVVTPYAVLTAAHCLSGPVPEVIVDGDRIAPVASFVSPAFDAVTLTSDIAILVFDPPLSVTPLPVAPASIAAGTTVMLVGFGRTFPDDMGMFAQRSGAAVIDSLEADGTFRSSGPARTCEGDSGGVALYEGTIVGVTSSGDDSCAVYSRHTRIDAVTATLEHLLASAAPRTREVGARCAFAAHCMTGTCEVALDDPRISLCTLGCIQGRCPEGTACVDELCRGLGPSPGTDGTECAADEDCAGELCVAPAGQSDAVCSQRCFSDLPGFECPRDMMCEPASDSGEACFARPDDTGCCSGSRSPSLALALLVFVQLLRGRGRP